MDNQVAQKLDDFFGKYRKQSFNKGAILIKGDQEPSGVFYLTSGVVRQYSITPSGEELTLNLYKTPSFFPMSWVINNTVNGHYYEAMSEVEAYKAPKGEVLKFLKENTDVLFDLIQRIYRGLEGVFLRLEHLMSGSAKNRLISELIIFAKRFGESSEDQTRINLKLTEKDLSAISGITRETVSRELHNLEERGILDFKRNILIINNLEKLEQELES